MRTILVVEDDKALRAIWQRALIMQGFSVYVAGNGREALALLENFVPALVVTDLTMPVLGGDKLIEAMRRNPRLAHIPVLTITGDVWAAPPAGYQVLEKPFPVKTLIETVRSLLGEV